MFKRNPKREGASGVVIWNPDDERLAEQAIEDVIGSQPEIGDKTPIQLDGSPNEQFRKSQKIKKKYQDLHVEKHGQDSPYYDTQE